MWFWIVFIGVGLIFVWSALQQSGGSWFETTNYTNKNKNHGKHGITRNKTKKEQPTPSPKKKKPFIRIERVED